MWNSFTTDAPPALSAGGTTYAGANGGVPDDQVVGDAAAAMQWLKSQPNSNGRVGIIGTCSGGRHALLVASRTPGFNAVVDLWGGGVVTPKEQLTPKQPVAPVEY